jgi:hypothetical protein
LDIIDRGLAEAFVVISTLFGDQFSQTPLSRVVRGTVFVLIFESVESPSYVLDVLLSLPRFDEYENDEYDDGCIDADERNASTHNKECEAVHQ